MWRQKVSSAMQDSEYPEDVARKGARLLYCRRQKSMQRDVGFSDTHKDETGP